MVDKKARKAQKKAFKKARRKFIQPWKTLTILSLVVALIATPLSIVFEMFDNMIGDIREYTASYLVKAKIRIDVMPQKPKGPVAMNVNRTENNAVKNNSTHIGRNDLCPCGSGKKYKNCCMLNENK